MPGMFLQQIRAAVAKLDPNDIRTAAERPVSIGLVASSSRSYNAMEDYFAPAAISRGKRWETASVLYRVGDAGAPRTVDIEIYEEGLPGPSDAFSFSPGNPERTVVQIIRQREALGLPLARRLFPFRQPVVDHVIHTIARENAVFALAAAIPDLMPNLLTMPWVIGEFASDTSFLTLNQVRMAFLIAAASDRPVGYREQRGQIGSIIAAAFGWRALARKMAEKIPFGAGVIPKAAIAFAGTYVEGLSLDRYSRLGYGFSRAERQIAYERALGDGAVAAGRLLARLRDRRRDSRAE